MYSNFQKIMYIVLFISQQLDKHARAVSCGDRSVRRAFQDPNKIDHF